jgi:hypothetical protein
MRERFLVYFIHARARKLAILRSQARELGELRSASSSTTCNRTIVHIKFRIEDILFVHKRYLGVRSITGSIGEQTLVFVQDKKAFEDGKWFSSLSKDQFLQLRHVLKLIEEDIKVFTASKLTERYKAHKKRSLLL